MKRSPWFSNNRASRRALFSNVKSKINDYAEALGLSPADVARILLICDTFLAVDSYVESHKASMESLIEWRDMVYEDDKEGLAPPPPAFTAFTPLPGMFCGIFDEFRRSVEQWKAAKGYTMAIGEDLMIVGNIEPPRPSDIYPNIAVETRPNYAVKISGKMQGMNAVRIEYQRKGSTGFQMVGILTSLVGEIVITPAAPGQPEAGVIRAIYLKKNESFGDYSPNYPVTISE